MKQRYVRSGVCTTPKLVNICSILTLLMKVITYYDKIEQLSVNFVVVYGTYDL